MSQAQVGSALAALVEKHGLGIPFRMLHWPSIRTFTPTMQIGTERRWKGVMTDWQWKDETWGFEGDHLGWELAPPKPKDLA